MIWQSTDYQNYVGYGLTTLLFLVLLAKIIASAYRQMIIAYFSAKMSYKQRLRADMSRSEAPISTDGMRQENVRL